MLLTDLINHTKEQYGEYPFLYDGEKEYTNLDMERVAKKISVLLRNHGVSDGERVLVSMENSSAVFFAYQGILRARNIVIPVMHILSPNEMAYILNDSKAKAIFTSSACLPNMIQAVKGLSHHVTIFVMDEVKDKELLEGYDVVDVYQAIETIEGSQEVVSDTDENNVAVILYTSGTTGRPKGVMLTHKNLIVGPLDSYHTKKTEGRIAERNTTVCVLPLAHIYGFGIMVTSFILGDSIVVFSKYDLEKVCQAIERFSVKTFAVVPAMLHDMTFSSTTNKYNLSSLESVNCGSASLPLAVIESFEKKFNAEIWEAYGLSESSTGGVSGHRKGVPVRRGSAGIPYPYVEVKIVDEEGNELPRGEVGEIIVKGENITPGYYGLYEETAKTIKNGWLYTGDIATMDNEDYIYIVDRKKDLIIRGGFNIYPRDLEEVLSKHEAVSEVAVIGLPDERMGEEVIACVVKKAGADVTEQGLIQYTQENLAKYKSPRRILFVEALPRNGVGKILKRKLRDELQGTDLTVS
ncbi:long-chain acyl-CoA synthetase [Mesobacillus persicus]|uniref:Long-chain acyl-CoA synthetase n=1 Tax=Mesobacillus persicus TaxID=930146 RepID=A0A1H8DB51_9BACI|nr:long-chain-fatty-acid--CoA ligase [Mesobacillus persicus]SEN04601.1 long-chain acyl-CoA synthetase [Mesobacillus persicus]